MKSSMWTNLSATTSKSILLALGMLASVATGDSASAQTVDRSYLYLCQNVANTAHNDLTQHDFSDHPVARRLASFTSDSNSLALERANGKAGNIRATLKALDDAEAQLATLGDKAQAFLPAGEHLAATRISFVCGAHSDGFGYKRDGRVDLFVDVGNTSDDFLLPLLTHELWHAAYRSAFPEQAGLEDVSMSPAVQLSFSLLNEGVGHYFSFQRRLEPEIVYDNWAERTSAIFSLFKEQYILLERKTGQQAKPQIYKGHAGVPFWKKWSAIPGAIATYRLRKTIGDEALRPLVKSGPCAFLSRYQELAKSNRAWETFPETFLKAACASEQNP